MKDRPESASYTLFGWCGWFLVMLDPQPSEQDLTRGSRMRQNKEMCLGRGRSESSAFDVVSIAWGEDGIVIFDRRRNGFKHYF